MGRNKELSPNIYNSNMYRYADSIRAASRLSDQVFHRYKTSYTHRSAVLSRSNRSLNCVFGVVGLCVCTKVKSYMLFRIMQHLYLHVKLVAKNVEINKYKK